MRAISTHEQIWVSQRSTEHTGRPGPHGRAGGSPPDPLASFAAAQPEHPSRTRVSQARKSMVGSATSENAWRRGCCERFRLASTQPRVSRSCLAARSEEHTSELQSPCNLVCRLLLEKKKKTDDKRRAHQ